MSKHPPPVRILIADDDVLMRDIAAVVLQQAGYQVETVANGAAAVAACARGLPDIALLDVDMPDGDGFQTCANIRSLPGGMSLPIVMVTGLDDPASIDLAYDAGATDFVVKPINWALLDHRIRYVLRGARTIEALRFSEQKNAALLKAIPDAILLIDAEGAIAHCFSPVEELRSAAHRNAPAASHLLDLIPEIAGQRARECLADAARGVPAVVEFSSGMDARTLRHFECRCLPNANGQVLAIIRDITARKEAEERIHRLAYFDALSGLPNREWIGDYLAQSLVHAQAQDGSVALLYVDLDQFKRINDTLGHVTGDALLRQVAVRLSGALGYLGLNDRPHELSAAPAVQTHDTDRVYGELARVGGDEFMVVLSGPRDAIHAEEAAERILAALAAPFIQDGFELVVTPSIGIAVYPEHGRDAQSLTKNADGAMYEAKAGGRNQFRMYNTALHARGLKRLSMEMELRRAFEGSDLKVFYQPKYDTHNLNLIGGEALLRWFHPRRGQIPTADFVAVAEETGLISEIGRWAMEQVCRDLCKWRSAGLVLPTMAVNVSGHDFMRPGSLLRLAEPVSEARLPPSLFELELTEGVLMRDAEAGRRSLHALKELGFALAVDDFGTGYCSLNYLKRFPLDTLKIDRSFVVDVSGDADGASIVRAIIALGHSLSLKIVAEGVTTPEQLRFLRAENCDAIQGFLMSPALAPEAFIELIREPQVTMAVGRTEARRRVVN